jgi:hypothetical protein
MQICVPPPLPLFLLFYSCFVYRPPLRLMAGLQFPEEESPSAVGLQVTPLEWVRPPGSSSPRMRTEVRRCW